jgi:hypothetical protein
LKNHVISIRCSSYDSAVLAGLGCKNRQEDLLKARLAGEAHAAVKRRKLTKAKAAELLSVKPADTSSIITGRPWCVEPAHRADRLDCAVEVAVRDKRAKRASAKAAA